MAIPVQQQHVLSSTSVVSQPVSQTTPLQQGSQLVSGSLARTAGIPSAGIPSQQAAGIPQHRIVSVQQTVYYVLGKIQEKDPASQQICERLKAEIVSKVRSLLSKTGNCILVFAVVGSPKPFSIC